MNAEGTEERVGGQQIGRGTEPDAPRPTKLDFRAAYEDRESCPWTEPRFGVGCRLLADNDEFSVPGMMRYLRDHFASGTVNAPPPDGAPLQRTVCLHPGIAQGSTAASMVVELAADELPLPPALETGDQHPSHDSAWWAMRELQYVTDRGPVLLTPMAQAAWAPIQQRLLAGGRLSADELALLTAEVMERRDRPILELTVAQLQHEHTITAHGDGASPAAAPAACIAGLLESS
ncbi:peptidase C69 family protein [Jiangella endophytica]|uniref:hypothetical protein n=1 Tax=Jiangella endophytica TaxID=1623398 RepID=UPI000E349EB3|nr:hypothetical protein [Jiangella endophytica]